MKGRVLLTGSTGFLGGSLLSALVLGGYRVSALKRSTSDLPRALQKGGKVDAYDADRGGIEDALSEQRIDAVIHAATTYDTPKTTFGQMLSSNLFLPIELFERALERGCPTFVNTGTVLGAGMNRYAMLKKRFADYAKANVQGRLRFFNMRLEHLYGPGGNDSRFAGWLISQLLSNRSPIPLTKGTQKRDFLYVKDAASACLCVLANPKKMRNGFIDLDVGTGKPVSIREFAELARELSGSRSRLEFGAVPMRKGEPACSSSESRLLRSMGWEPRTQLREGLAATIESMRGGGA